MSLRLSSILKKIFKTFFSPMHALISVLSTSLGFNLIKFLAMKMSTFFLAKSSPEDFFYCDINAFMSKCYFIFSYVYYLFRASCNNPSKVVTLPFSYMDNFEVVSSMKSFIYHFIKYFVSCLIFDTISGDFD